MKRVLFVALALGAMAGGVYASQNLVVAAPKAANVYTYYLEDDCDSPVSCSPEYAGAVCAEAFDGLIVYDQPGCELAHQTSNIIGKKQP